MRRLRRLACRTDTKVTASGWSPFRASAKCGLVSLVMVGSVRVSVILAAGPLGSRAIRSRTNVGTWSPPKPTISSPDAGPRQRRVRPARCWNQATVAATAWGCGVGSKGPKALSNLEASTTKGRSHWYSISVLSRARGSKRPASRSASREVAVTLTGRPSAAAMRLDEPSAGHRFGRRQVPDLTKRFRSRSQDDQRPGHVREVVQAVRQVHAAHPPGSVTLDGRAEQDVADDAVGPTRSVVVRGASDGHLEGSPNGGRPVAARP